MKIQRDVFTAAVNAASKFAERRATLPMLESILLTPGPGHLSLTATNLEVGVELKISAAVDAGDVPVVLPAKQLLQILKAIPKAVKEIDLTTARLANDAPDGPGQTYAYLNGGLTLTSSADAKDFPCVVAPKGETIHLPGLLDALDRVVGAVSHDETRYALNGVYLNAEHGHVVSTDGYRMHVANIWKQHQKRAVIMPRNAVCALLSAPVRKLTEDFIAVTMGEGSMALHLTEGGVTGIMVTRYIDGTFPNYEAVMPKEYEVEAALPAAAFIEALQQGCVIAEERNKPVEIRLRDGKVIVHASNNGGGEINADVADASYDGPDMRIGFNARYLLDAVEAMGGDTITLRLRDALSPGTLLNEVLTIVIMPMRMGDEKPAAQPAAAPVEIEEIENDDEGALTAVELAVVADVVATTPEPAEAEPVAEPVAALPPPRITWTLTPPPAVRAA